MNNTASLAALLRAYHGNLTRKELKVMRAKLRRAGVTCLHKDVKGAYTVNPSIDVATDTRADVGTIVAQVVAMTKAA